MDEMYRLFTPNDFLFGGSRCEPDETVKVLQPLDSYHPNNLMSRPRHHTLFSIDAILPNGICDQRGHDAQVTSKISC
jgi:hypothetical protein